MKYLYLFSLSLLSFLFIGHNTVLAQCSSYPVPFEQRIMQSKYIVQGKVVEQHCYIDAATGHVNTLNKFNVAAWLKNGSRITEVYVITLGGVYGNRAMSVHPSLQLDMDHEYLLMLEDDKGKEEDKQFRALNPTALQVFAYADEQGSLTNERNYYYDKHYRTPKTETNIFKEIENFTHVPATKPSGELFVARPIIDRIFNGPQVNNVITSFSPNPTRSGTINPADYITISGSGFGVSGTVFYTNADDGGATFTSSGVATDNVSWNDATIVTKPARAGGTGPINVNGAMTSGSSLTINYSLLNINSTFNGFGTATRQLTHLVNKNGTGGYTYTYNAAFAANAAAKAAFERSLFLWRCGTGVNFGRSITTSAIGTASLDGVNIVTFDATLPVGVLGRATNYSGGSATGACTTTNTVWWTDEIDMQFFPDPPSAGFPWNYGPSLPTFTQYDFESVASHEIGHHVGQGHVIASGQLMHFALANGSSNRTLAVNDLAGAAAKMSFSTAPLCFTPATVSGPMTALTAGSCLLPISSLVDFNGQRKNESTNQLSWSTSYENNNKGFYIQRSKDGTNFTDITFIKGAGNSTAIIPYSYPDESAGVGAYYYRLRQVDLDSRQSFSNIIFIDGSKTAIKVWASETGSKMSVYMKAFNKNAVVKLINSEGKQVLQQQLNTSFQEINTNHLAKGLYYYQLQLDNTILSGKLLLGGQ